VDAGLHPNDCSKSGYSVLAITRGANIRKGSAAKNRAEARKHWKDMMLQQICGMCPALFK
jgi:hypothetical protein